MLLLKSTISIAISDSSSVKDKKIVEIRNSKAFDAQLLNENAVYVIKRKINLKGKTIIMPHNSVLLFKSKGNLFNGTIVGNQTQIKAPKRMIMSNLKISPEGTWNNNRGYPEWFGPCNKNSFDAKSAIQNAIDVADTCVLSQTYFTSYDTPTGRGDDIRVCAIAISGKTLIGQSKSKLCIDAKHSNTERTSVFWIGDNVVIDGVNIEFFNEDHSGWTGTQAGVYRIQGGNVTIKDTELHGAMAAWINLEGKTGRRNYVIKDNFVHDCDCGLIIQGNQHQPNEVYDINLLMENNIIEKEKNRHSEMISFWGCAKDSGMVYYTNVTIKGNKFSGGWQGGCITGNQKYNGLRKVTIKDNEFYDCGACSFYNCDGLVYERNYVTGSTFVERQVKGVKGSYPNLAFANCKNCTVDDVSCFGLTFTDSKGFKIGKVKQTLGIDINDPYLSQKDYITNFIGIKADNSSVSIDELTVNPFNDTNATSDKCRYYIFKANDSEVNVEKMRSSIPVQDSKKLLKVKDLKAYK